MPEYEFICVRCQKPALVNYPRIYPGACSYSEGRYEVFMDAGDGEAVKGVLEPKEEKQPPSAKNGSSLLSGKQMPFDFQRI